MAIYINPTTSGFRKWSEAHPPKRTGEATARVAEAGVKDGVAAAPDADQRVMVPDEQPHRPWLVPGTGKL